jgi:hypothetical protein
LREVDIRKRIIGFFVCSLFIILLFSNTNASTPETAPEISISGGLRGKIWVEIKNVGLDEYKNITWSINIPTIIPDRWSWEGQILSLSPGESVNISTDGFIFGLTKTYVDVTVKPEGYPIFDSKANSIIFLCIIFIRSH